MLVAAAKPSAVFAVFACLVNVEALGSVLTVREVGARFRGMEEGTTLLFAEGEKSALLFVERFQLPFYALLSRRCFLGRLFLVFNGFPWDGLILLI